MLIALVAIGAAVALGILGLVLTLYLKNRSRRELGATPVVDPVTQVIRTASDIRSSVLTVVEGNQSGQVFTPRGMVVSIGRGGSNQVRLTDPTASRNSAKISWTGEGWVLINDDSVNPVIVDEQEVPKTSPMPLNDGSLIQIGKTKLMFRPIEYQVA